MNKIILENMKSYLMGVKEDCTDSHIELYLTIIDSYLALLLDRIKNE